MPPTVLAKADMPSARPASPFWAIGKPSSDVAEAAGVPGELMRMAVIEPP